VARPRPAAEPSARERGNAVGLTVMPDRVFFLVLINFGGRGMRPN